MRWGNTHTVYFQELPVQSHGLQPGTFQQTRSVSLNHIQLMCVDILSILHLHHVQCMSEAQLQYLSTFLGETLLPCVLRDQWHSRTCVNLHQVTADLSPTTRVMGLLWGPPRFRMTCSGLYLLSWLSFMGLQEAFPEAPVTFGDLDPHTLANWPFFLRWWQTVSQNPQECSLWPSLPHQ